MKSILIILAGGKGSRASNVKNKQFISINGKTILEHTLNKFKTIYSKKNIIIVLPSSKINSKSSDIYNKYTCHRFILGGSTRKKSVENSIKYIETMKTLPENVLIHDAARPNVSKKLIRTIKNKIHNKNINYVIPYKEVVSTLKRKLLKKYKTENRNNFITTQTPQAFKFDILKSICLNNYKASDESQLAENYRIKNGIYIKGDIENFKITTKSDLNIFKMITTNKLCFRVGNGFDVHRLVKGNGIILGGIKIKSDKKLAGHSDGDVIIHALCDSILGALSKKDIGTYFPSSNPKFKEADSSIFLIKIMKFIHNSSYNISNVDITIICQAPSLKNYKEKIKKNLLKLTKLKSNQLNVKAKTTDYLGLIGNSKAISCWITTTIKN